MSTLFVTERAIVRPAEAADASALARFCRENPDYDILLTGKVPEEAAWVEDFMTSQPSRAFGWTSAHKLVALAPEDPARIVAVLDVVEDMISPGVAHIGLFQVAQALHGSGLADALYRALEVWLVSRGMDAFRLGVLEANRRGQAFWARHGYIQSRTRPVPDLTAPDGGPHVTRVMFKPTRPCSVAQWQARVPRDHPDTP